MTPYVFFLKDTDRAGADLAGGKGANLGELIKTGVPVPDGFCVTTSAYRDFIGSTSRMEDFLKELRECADTPTLRQLSETIRFYLENLNIPGRIQAEICEALSCKSPDTFYAIRSSATAEDLPSASFAGQHDTYLNIKGQENILEHVKKCWASLFTDRAIVYRAKGGFAHNEVYLAVVVQEMVVPEVSGIMFTADPTSGNRTVVAINAGFGLGEALVSGLTSPDLYQVKNGGIIHKKIAKKKLAIYPLPGGGTVTRDLPSAQAEEQALTDGQIVALATLGKKIERHFGAPQDIEFCVAGGDFFIVQSRPVTTLYPLPDMPLQPLRALFSFGHVQMNTGALKPLGISVLKTVLPTGMAHEAGGRIFLDLTDLFYSKIIRAVLPKLLTNADESMSRSMEEIIKRPDFLAAARPENPDALPNARKAIIGFLRQAWKNMNEADPQEGETIVLKYVEEKIAQVRESLAQTTGARRIKVIKEQLDTIIFPGAAQNLAPYVAAGIIANKLLQKMLWREMKNTDELARLNMSLPGNITSRMGLELGDVADVLRELPAVLEHVKTSEGDFLTGLDRIDGGDIFRQAMEDFLEKYGMRCPGEIDLSKPRWREELSQLKPALLNHVAGMGSGEHRLRFIAGEKEAKAAERRILAKMDGNYFKAKLAARLIALFRNLGGLREYPKYMLVTVLDECKKAIMAEAAALARNGTLAAAEDIYYLKLEEIIQILQGGFAGDIGRLIAARKEEHLRYQSLKPPRVMTSEGEIIAAVWLKDGLPAGALAGSGVSSGVAEGVARVILEPGSAVLQRGEILVAPHTDPGWTVLFQSAGAIVTEAGGLMTHGAVVAREYGIPAVVGVDGATTAIRDGEKIRVDGDRGFVERMSSV